MKTKYIFYLFLIGFIYSSCDKIEAPFRENIVVSDFCATGIEDSVVHKKVLVEDYTGHLCGDCPYAGVYLNDTLKPLYNHCLVVISVHAGFFAGVCPGAFACHGDEPPGAFTSDYNSVAGSAWNTFFAITGNPKGMINRIDYPSAHSKGYKAWAPAIASELEKSAQASINITNSFNAASNSVNVSVKTKLITSLTGEYKLQVVITEDSLIDWQVWYPPVTPEFDSTYNHRHVLRDAINSTWGETLMNGTLPAGDSFTKNYNYTINANWNVNHCSIVAFLYKADTYEVVQVEEAPVN